ncbi:protein translocase subunit SecF [Streptomyces sp. JJ36]|uniref:protein translocase subunit SecF n=1 Tax=Streptomyces sp. JJ36 TaxID=2736645 RepID=UPI001F018765|nr:protein translocase subunit SecF [Streptomyces sp. JJ36]MCF6525310.1 protein translocase subunit SecF [Streptomyces sp. JJ36]
MSRLGNLGAKLYRGETSYDFVGHRKLWYGITLAFVVVALLGLGLRGLFMGIEFQGGAVFTTPPKASISEAEARDIAQDTADRDARVQELGNGALRVQVTDLDTEQSGETRAALADALGVPTQDINAELVGPSWGDQMTDKALQGIVVFLALVSVYLAIAFEWRMAVAALVALVHDLVITVGVYAIVGFEVTPGTVVGMLTILGYSLYDTVVVFDKVKEKTRALTKQDRYTYSELANLGINATVVRSVNTSVVALLPVGALLFIGSGLLGGGMLKDIALSLFVGLAAGTFSSIVIATPVVVDLKTREPAVREHDRRILARRARAGTREGEPAGADGTAGEGSPAGAPAGDRAPAAPAGAAGPSGHRARGR